MEKHTGSLNSSPVTQALAEALINTRTVVHATALQKNRLDHLSSHRRGKIGFSCYKLQPIENGKIQGFRHTAIQALAEVLEDRQGFLQGAHQEV